MYPDGPVKRPDPSFWELIFGKKSWPPYLNLDFDVEKSKATISNKTKTQTSTGDSEQTEASNADALPNETNKPEKHSDMKTNQTNNNIQIWDEVLDLALKMPFVKVDRDKFLRTELQGMCKPEQLEAAIACPPAVLRPDTLERIAKGCISYHTKAVTGLSIAAGIPGGFTLFATIPADLAQFYGQLMCLVQKLSYLYGHEDFTENGKISDYTRNQLTVMLGVAFGVNAAQKALKQLVQQLSIETAKRLPRMALTKTFYYPIIKQVAKWLGTNLTKNTFSRGAAKAIPLFGGVINGGIAYYSFKKVAKRFHKAMMEHPVMQASDAHAHDSHAHHEDHSDEYVEVVEEVTD